MQMKILAEWFKLTSDRLFLNGDHCRYVFICLHIAAFLSRRTSDPPNHLSCIPGAQQQPRFSTQLRTTVIQVRPLIRHGVRSATPAADLFVA